MFVVQMDGQRDGHVVTFKVVNPDGQLEKGITQVCFLRHYDARQNV